MKLPKGDGVLIDPRKINDYCLSHDHDDGKHSARLFHDLLRLSTESAALLLDDLKRAVVNGDATLGKLDKYGQRYVIDFEFVGPGVQAILRSAWIVRSDEDFPRLVTC